MNYSMHITCLLLPALVDNAEAKALLEAAQPRSLKDKVNQVGEAVIQTLVQHCEEFVSQPVDPEKTLDFERHLQEELRELGRRLTQETYNHVEPVAATLPKHVVFEASLYTRLNRKWAQNVWTLFGQVRLQRVGYRPSDKSGDPTIFPLAMALGLIAGATPALAERAAGLMSDTGMTQQTVLDRLKRENGVGWGVKKLRQVTAWVSAEMAEQRQAAQVEELLALLRQATAGTGKHKPVLSVGRDGITLGMRCQGGSVYEVATCATVTVLDRRGKRLGTVYLAYVPELGQGTMSQQLTQLLKEVLKRWEGPLPRLSYVTDSGDNETSYYTKVLSRMKHPRTGKRLEWIRVADYYHASERLWTMGDLLFGKGERAWTWVRKMQKWLLKPGGVNRVLHSAAALRKLYELKGKQRKEFQKAYRYLRNRMAYMKYAEYRKWGIPLGSGITEAGCKTVYTQRLKLSGMRWKKAGAQSILNLRVLRLSGVWEDAYRRVLQEMRQPQVRSHKPKRKTRRAKAA